MDLCLNIVAVLKPDGLWAFQQVWGSLFGLASSVINFLRTPLCVTALCRRLLFVLKGMFVDDSYMLDLVVGAKSAQSRCGELWALLGWPFDPKKHHAMAAANDFLAAICHVGQALVTRQIPVALRARLLTKFAGLAERLRRPGQLCRPRLASEVVGLLGFLAVGCATRVLRAAQSPFRRRLRQTCGPWNVDAPMLAALRLADHILTGGTLERVVELYPRRGPPLVVASDARDDPGAPPSLALVVLDLASGDRWGLFAVAGGATLEVWRQAGSMIDVAECAPPAVAFYLMGSAFRGRDVYWYIDNTGALAAHVSGGSAEPACDAACGMTKLLEWHFSCPCVVGVCGFRRQLGRLPVP